MRFDNPIYEHGFVFPDIAEFPDVKNEPRYGGNGNEQSISIMKEAIQKSDLNMFQNGYQYYMKNVDTKLFNKLNTMFQFYANFENNRLESDLPSNKIYEDLFENGISYLTADIKELQTKLEPDINALLQQPDWRPPPGQFDRAKQLGPEYIKLVNDMFSKLGVLQGATKYNKGKPLQVKNVVLHIATPTDQNWKQFLYDCNTVTKTTNLHIDPKEDVIKSMMYLNDITLDDGPFSYVEKSNRWIYDDLQNIFGRAISTGSYCHTPESRAVVFQLPKQLRISHNFGRVLLDNTEEQQNIIDKEKMFTSDKGNVCIFDPAGMHRGGICTKGTRIALQILMK
tara:strand:- start:1329 stop:2345 length:1017 start_codon:yes stop_codon:yes gene_type:complete